MNREMPIFIETARLIITAPQESDFDLLYELMTDADVMKFIGSGGPISKDMVRDKLQLSISHYKKHGFSAGCVYEKDSMQFIGRAGLFYLEYDDTQPEIEIGYSLHKKYWGKGYASELAKAFIEWGFQHLNIDKLVAVTFPDNVASRRVLEKAGMRCIGAVRVYSGPNRTPIPATSEH